MALDVLALDTSELVALRDACDAELGRRALIEDADQRHEEEIDTYEAAVAEESPLIWEEIPPTMGIGPGRRIVFTNGETYRNRSRGWLNIAAGPDVYPWGWERETGLPDPGDVEPWEPGGTYTKGELRTWGDVIHVCQLTHTNYDPTHTPNLTPTLWLPQVSAA